MALLAFAVAASASTPDHASRGSHSVRLIHIPGGGTIIRVHESGQRRTFVLSPEMIAEAAVRDVDADGDLDIVATSGPDLVVWRNLGSGRYVLAPAPSRHKFHHRSSPGLAPSRLTSQTSGLGEQRQPPASASSTATAKVSPAASAAHQSVSATLASASPIHAGRAPPLTL
jgi:hypothetical protein